MRTALIALAIGCGGAPMTTQVEPVGTTAKPSFASYAIMTGELGDAGIIARIPHHARLARIGRMWLALDGELARDGSVEKLSVSEVVPVIGESRDRVRVVSSDDDANLAVWIERTDLARVIVRETKLEALEHMDPGVGVWLAPGTELEPDVKRDQTSREHLGVKVRDLDIDISGWTSTKSVGTVWVGDVPALELAPPINPMSLAGGARVHASPSFDAADLAVVGHDAIDVSIRESHKPWVEIEIERGGARVRGFVRVEELTDFTNGTGHGSGRGHGYGMSDIGKLVVAENACLYDRPNGDVIGVNTKTRERHGRLAPNTEWGRVYADTDYWGVVELFVHVVSVRPNDIVWETCAGTR